MTGPTSHHAHLSTLLSHWIQSLGMEAESQGGPMAPGWGRYCPHCSNDLFQRQALHSQVLQRPHISLEFGVQDNISDYSITYPTNKYLLSIYDALAAALVQSVPALTEHCPGCCFFIRGLYRHVPSYIRYSHSPFGQYLGNLS